MGAGCACKRRRHGKTARRRRRRKRPEDGESTVGIRDKLAAVTWEGSAGLGRGKPERSILAAPSRHGAGQK